MVSIKPEFFDLSKITTSGQVFRMYKRETGAAGAPVFDVYSKDKYLAVSQRGNEVIFYCDPVEYETYWKNYFDLNYDYVAAASGITDDEYLKQALSFGEGIRLLNQDIWEATVSFIISQQKQIPSIRKCIEALCARFGKECTGTNEHGDRVIYHAFPTPAEIVKDGPDGLKGLSLGYRERYIYETAIAYLERALPDEKVRTLGYKNALDYFMSFTGVGEKVANCICLFAAGYKDAFPIDTHIKDILYREYYLKRENNPVPPRARDSLCMKDYQKLGEKYFSRYLGYRGVVQQWTFAMETVKS